MIQDRAQKAQALKYIVGKRWLPQLEVDVVARGGTAESDKPLTDIDVLACIPDDFEGFRNLLIDCKTKKKESPITRALWLRGLMDQLEATRGICIFLRDTIEPDHRQTAAQFGVALLTEAEFGIYANATGAKGDATDANCADIQRWDEYFELSQRYQMLGQTISFCTSGYWMRASGMEACRHVIAESVRIRPELDPQKRAHIAVVFDLAALFAHSLARIVSRIFASYLQPKNRDELSDALLTLLYGGRDRYEHLVSLRRLIATSPASPDKPLTLPEWDRFLQLVRHALDAPTELSFVPLILREVGWSFLGTERLDFATVLAAEKRQASKLALLAAEYIAKAAKYPPEFTSVISERMLSLQQTPTH